MNIDGCSVPFAGLADTGLSIQLVAIVCAIAVSVIGVVVVVRQRSRAVTVALALLVGCGAAPFVAATTPANASPVCTASLSGHVWFDADQDGIRHDNEIPETNVSVALSSVTGETLATLATDATGHYMFDSLPAGNYKVLFSTRVNGRRLTVQGIGADDRNSDADSSGVTRVIALSTGQHITNIDAGYIPTASQTPTVTPPGSTSPHTTGTPTVSSSPSPSGAASASPATSSAAPPSVPTHNPSSESSTGKIGNRVWWDIDYDMRQDTGEPGIQGVRILLIDANTGDVKGTRVTDSNGVYEFTGLAAGTYILRFDTSAHLSAADGDVFISDHPDNPASTSSGFTASYRLSSGENITTVNVGYAQPRF